MNGPETLLAGEAVAKYGNSLVGRQVDTIRYGAWPGGIARITEVNPDPDSAPEIAMTVEAMYPVNSLVAIAIQKGDLEHGVMGVFEHEEVVLLVPASTNSESEVGA